jgi:hypothetical protein
MRYGLTDYEWVSIKPFLPNKPRGAEVAQLSNCHDHNHDDDTAAGPLYRTSLVTLARVMVAADIRALTDL